MRPRPTGLRRAPLASLTPAIAVALALAGAGCTADDGDDAADRGLVAYVLCDDDAAAEARELAAPLSAADFAGEYFLLERELCGFAGCRTELQLNLGDAAIAFRPEQVLDADDYPAELRPWSGAPTRWILVAATETDAPRLVVTDEALDRAESFALLSYGVCRATFSDNAQGSFTLGRVAPRE